MSYSKIIVGTDGSDTATSAVHAAIGLAKTLDVPLIIATAWRRDPGEKPPRSEASHIPGGSLAPHEYRWAEETATDAAAEARAAGVSDVRQMTPVGSPADALVNVGDAHADSLVVVGTRGLTERAERIVGNVPHALTHHSHRDLLLVNTAEGDNPMWNTVALATDGTETATMACQHGLDLARSIGATATLLTVAKSEDAGDEALDQTAAQLDDSQIDRRVVVDKHPVDALVRVAPEYDLLVIGNKGMSGPSRLLGSVSNPITHEAPTDLLLVNTSR